MALDPLTAALDLGGKLIDKFFPDPAQAADAKLKLLTMQQNGELAQLTADTDLAKAQLAVNANEAQSTNWFVAGARPFVIWGCAVSMLYVSLFEPIARFVAQVCFHYTGAFPVIDTSLTTQLLLGLLIPMAGMRTFEKFKGVEGNR